VGTGQQGKAGGPVFFGIRSSLNDLIARVNALPGMKSPNKQALVSPLQSSLGALAAKNKSSACSSMQSFISLVNAQTRKKLISGDAGAGLINDANRIRKVIGCSKARHPIDTGQGQGMFALAL
jgi:hypothetical protein